MNSNMSLNRVCNRCFKVDTENFGSLQQCQKTNLSIYICFECTDICDYCKQRPSVILQNPKTNKYSCMECYNRLERN